ncbi:SpoIIE family protein phosphatase [Leptospira yasudae]|uniref:HAMP domain-containing protein n=1 Tax=Leptospira yasudae TaxID=2202201 RepID=A0A6N4QYR2_9LEPT|nr:SpoIIE family protein phosphatase [Leptospira yasudae]TGL77048.1 HAMP domain-containing protein [Leptospira yasudae]TGL83897.1 HAMP domain-containing protein [Leptospira yasudae]TGL89915.1 HAMP domain-containing protein [Leptospira yasudae]
MKRSLRLQIISIYSLLTVINLTFVAVMIFENQTDLLIDNFTLESDQIARKILKKIEGLESQNYEDPDKLADIESKLLSIGVENFSVISVEDRSVEKFKINLEHGNRISIDYLKGKLATIINAKEAINSSYDIELDSKNFIVNLIFYLTEKTFLVSQVRVKEILDRLNSLYIQLALLLLWGVVFHILFGIFLYRKIFVRLFILKEASETMASGDLTVRAGWNFSSKDELDLLGSTFNGMVERIASQVESLEHKNQQIQTELEIGKNVQECLLPGRRRKFNLITADIFYQPMREVSGDIYDIIEINDERTGFFLADATGHGVSAALITSIIHFNIENIMKETVNPSFIFTRLSEKLFDTLQGSFFATGIFMLFDKEGSAYFCSAGHNPIYYYRKSKNKIVTLNSTGHILGIGIPEEYEVLKIKTEPGDKILIYTDGILDATAPTGEQFGDDRLLQTFQANVHQEAKQITNEIKKEMEVFADRFPDDVTFGIIEIQ